MNSTILCWPTKDSLSTNRFEQFSLEQLSLEQSAANLKSSTDRRREGTKLAAFQRRNSEAKLSKGALRSGRLKSFRLVAQGARLPGQ